MHYEYGFDGIELGSGVVMDALNPIFRNNQDPEPRAFRTGQVAGEFGVAGLILETNYHRSRTIHAG
jgi:hypothetical protein